MLKFLKQNGIEFTQNITTYIASPLNGPNNEASLKILPRKWQENVVSTFFLVISTYLKLVDFACTKCANIAKYMS